jgi:hypothetical protein
MGGGVIDMKNSIFGGGLARAAGAALCAAAFLFSGCDQATGSSGPKLTGAVTIEGELVVGVTLRAKVENVPESVKELLQYEWQRSESTYGLQVLAALEGEAQKAGGETDKIVWESIAGASGSTYTLTPQDKDRYIRVLVKAEGYNGLLEPEADEIERKAVTEKPNTDGETGTGDGAGGEDGNDQDVEAEDEPEPEDQPNVGGGPGPRIAVIVSSITLSRVEGEELIPLESDVPLELEIEETVQLRATTEPPDVPVEWYSSKKSAVTVDDTGLVTMVSTAAVVTAKAGGKTASCEVNVKEGSELAGLYQITSETGKNYIPEASARTEATMLAKALAYIKENGANSTAYEILLDADEPDAPMYYIGSGNSSQATGTGAKTGLTITLKGTKSGNIEENITITKSGAGALFTVCGNTAADTPHLILENITLRGNDSNTEALVVVGNTVTNKKGQLTMKDGGRITGNTNTGGSTRPGGIRLNSEGTFIMDGGSIDNNKGTETTKGRGGILASANTTITMNGGVIENNESGYSGSAVFSSGTFNMTGGVIRRNKSAAGTVVQATIFKKTGGIIYGSEDAAGENANENNSTIGSTSIMASGSKVRNTTAGEDDDLDSTKDGAEGGWES